MKVMVFGSFDVLHDGHRSLFSQAKQYGDYLLVVVSRDTTYEKLRGYKPVHNEEERVTNVQSEPLVDKALLGSTTDVYAVLREERPDVICLGYDQEAFIDKLEEKLHSFNLRAKIIRLRAYKPDTYKSSLLKNQ